jgi:hypothetical protein
MLCFIKGLKRKVCNAGLFPDRFPGGENLAMSMLNLLYSGRDLVFSRLLWGPGGPAAQYWLAWYLLGFTTFSGQLFHPMKQFVPSRAAFALLRGLKLCNFRLVARLRSLMLRIKKATGVGEAWARYRAIYICARLVAGSIVTPAIGRMLNCDLPMRSGRESFGTVARTNPHLQAAGEKSTRWWLHSRHGSPRV